MKRIAPGFYAQPLNGKSKYQFNVFLRIGKRWFCAQSVWSLPTKPEQRRNIEPYCRGLGYPTLAQAVSAMQGNRVS